MDLNLNNKVSLITASSRGIGKAIAQKLAEEGSEVIICGRSSENLMETADNIRKSTGKNALWKKCDLTQPNEVKLLMSFILSTYKKIDCLVANGGPSPRRGDFLSYKDEEWQMSFESNNLQVIRIIREVLPIMLDNGGGNIVTITSSSVKQPITEQWMSNSMRPGIWGLVKSLALEYAAQGIRINNIAPGRIETERTNLLDEKKAHQLGISIEKAKELHFSRIPMRRIGKTEEIADTAAFLLSDRASYITGNTVHVDGGMVRSL